MASESRRRLVCRCMGIASPRIYEAVRVGGLAAVADVTKACRAGGGCGLCHPEIEEILADVRGDPFDASLSLENQLVCRQETLARIEGSLASLIAPRVGVRIASLAVDGLRVRVTLGGNADAATGARVGAKLREYVCDQLEVEVDWQGC